VSDIEKRLQNTERALVALWALMKDAMPPGQQNSIEKMINEYFDANEALGANFTLSEGFDD